MKTILAQSVRLARFHTLLMIVLFASIICLVLRYFDMAQANIEEFTFTRTMHKLSEELLGIDLLYPESVNNKCNELKKNDYLHRLGNMRHWSYSSERLTLIYNVYNNTYFHSEEGQKIIVQFKCDKANISYTVSPHQWCAVKKLWGCSKW